MSEFLNPKSMVTPGAAGALMMLIVNGVSRPFPEVPARYLALVLSFVMGALVVFKASRMKIPESLAYWVLNSLVIFVVGFGSNNLGREAGGAGAPVASALVALVPSAYAQVPTETPPGKGNKNDDSSALASSQEESKKLQAELDRLRQENVELKEKAQKDEKKKPPDSFFKKW